MANEFEYAPNEINSDMFISEIPLSLMKENIIAQFNDPLEYRKKDHLTTFITMYDYSKENADAFEDEEMDSVNKLRDDFYSFMLEMFHNYLNIGFPEFDNLSDEEQNNLIHFTYRFFLINIKKNFVTFIYNSIMDNKERFLLDEDEIGKDVTTIALKKEVSDQADISILAKLDNVIDTILGDDIDIDDFFEKCDDDSCLETRFVSEQFDKFNITGNFIAPYISMIDLDFRSTIESKIRNKILKKYKK